MYQLDICAVYASDQVNYPKELQKYQFAPQIIFWHRTYPSFNEIALHICAKLRLTHDAEIHKINTELMSFAAE